MRRRGGRRGRERAGGRGGRPGGPPRGGGGPTLDLRVSALDPDTGEGLCQAGGQHGSGDEGRALRVAGALPGERVRVEPARGGTGRLLAVLEPAPERVVPRCRHAAECGGCAWQHLSYPAQLRWKQERVAGALRAALGREVPVRPTRGLEPGPAPDSHAPPGADPSAPWGFRDKVHFVLGPERHGRGGGLALGHYRRGTQDLLPVTECPVHAPAGNALAFAGAELLRRLRVPGADPRTLQGLARHLVVRVGEGSGQALVTLVATRERVERLKEWVAGLRALPIPPDGIHLDVHASPGPYLFGREGRKLFGRARLMEELHGTRYLVSPTAFFQTSSRGAALLIEEVLGRVPTAGPVLDLFAGAGLFALPLARRGQPVLAVEENRAAVQDGVASRELNQIPPERCRFLSGRVEQLLPRLFAEEGPCVAAVLDPPRDGCPPGTLELLSRLGLPRLVYVSCHPDALARDVALAARLGWSPQDVQPIDMFPHTPHVETVVTLRR